jgi:hypothetical protein
MKGGKMEAKLNKELDEAERKAWDSLARYKFQMFGYWAAIFVHLNRLLADVCNTKPRPNPWAYVVRVAQEKTS